MASPTRAERPTPRAWLSRLDPGTPLHLLVQAAVLAWTWLWLLPVGFSDVWMRCGLLSWAHVPFLGPFDIDTPDLWLPLDQVRWSPSRLAASLALWLFGLVALEWAARRRHRAVTSRAGLAP